MGPAASFTNADNFSLTFGPQLDPLVRTLLLGATFLIDFVHFESEPQHHHD